MSTLLPKSMHNEVGSTLFGDSIFNNRRRSRKKTAMIFLDEPLLVTFLKDLVFVNLYGNNGLIFKFFRHFFNAFDAFSRIYGNISDIKCKMCSCDFQSSDDSSSNCPCLIPRYHMSFLKTIGSGRNGFSFKTIFQSLTTVSRNSRLPQECCKGSLVSKVTTFEKPISNAPWHQEWLQLVFADCTRCFFVQALAM